MIQSNGEINNAQANLAQQTPYFFKIDHGNNAMHRNKQNLRILADISVHSGLKSNKHKQLKLLS